ncbi:FecR domain-containing protein [Pseudomonas sp. NPDC089392]|uniref:FecR domain-containing protein n=1 Tax=Pseudomonas sp. NPDC089392 TaxID=3364459 RepID=UPI00382BC194
MNLSDRHLALRAAAQWHARLGAAPDCAQTRRLQQDWLALDPLHQWAWARVERLHASFNDVPGTLARQTLSDSPSLMGRRAMLKGVMLGLCTAPLIGGAYLHSSEWFADLRTRVGERRNLTLVDGTRLSLNTATAVDIRYDTQQRLIVLHAGEILIETAADSRPLLVRSPHGEMRALGTRFNVRLYTEHTRLTVLEHTVAVRNASSTGQVIVDAGLRMDFADGPLGAPRPADLSQSEWRQGRLVIDGWRLDRTLQELERYRPGFIRCSEAVAGMRVSGVFPLDDIDRTLQVIAQALKLNMQTRTRYWVRFSQMA